MSAITCDECTRADLVRATAGRGLPAIEPGMPLPAGTGLSRRKFVAKSLGLALSVYDELTVTVRDEPGVTVTVVAERVQYYGKDGKLHVEGLGGSYGVERLAFYKMLPEMGPPETTIWEFPRGDRSWALEFEEFLEDIRLNRTPSASLADARAALAIVAEIYRQSPVSNPQSLIPNPQ